MNLSRNVEVQQLLFGIVRYSDIGALLNFEPVNDRKIIARFKLMTGNLTICLVYAPTAAVE